MAVLLHCVLSGLFSHYESDASREHFDRLCCGSLYGCTRPLQQTFRCFSACSGRGAWTDNHAFAYRPANLSSHLTWGQKVYSL